ncbi:heterochromatin protein 1 [Drosophila willistoni]|uniref:heterochromatin protein 1 n=1 Tax=Drosophila willistoni TaxID=7260 RepID=UPI00017D91F0|nr:heterochromatin protein 1 [Drosophila willistoni]
MENSSDNVKIEAKPPSPSSEKPKEYTVEKVLDCRLQNDKVEYLLKWKDYPENESTWEPEENLNCQELIQEYKLSCIDRENAASSGESCPARNFVADTQGASTLVDGASGNNKSSLRNGFDRGLEVENILGIYFDQSKQRKLIIKFKGVTKPEIISSELANQKIPRMVIEFYAKRLT